MATTCPKQCTVKYNGWACPHHNLKVQNPALMRTWNWGKNERLPETYASQSHCKVWWKCPKGHEWRSAINHRVNGSRCPTCSLSRTTKTHNLANKFPDLIREWDWEKNTANPEDYAPFSNFKVWWRCSYGHEWEASIKLRAQGSTCPKCSRTRVTPENNLLVKFPHLIEEWDWSKNECTPLEYTPFSNRSVHWKCTAAGHEWKTKIITRTKKYNYECPQCKRKYEHKRK